MPLIHRCQVCLLKLWGCSLQIMKMMHAPMEVEETYIRHLAIFVSVTLIFLLFFIITKKKLYNI